MPRARLRAVVGPAAVLLPLVLSVAGLGSGCATTSPLASSPRAGEVPGLTVASPLEVQAEEAVRRQDWVEAEARTQALTAAEPDSARAWLLRGMALLGRERRAEAAEALERSVALGDSAQARYNLGITRAQEGQVEQARGHFARAVELQADYGLGWKSLAKAEAALGHFPEAARALEEARRLRPADAEVEALDTQLAQVLAVQGVPREALAHHARAGALAQQGRDEEARAAYAAALAVHPAFADAHLRLGVSWLERGEPARAEEALRAALAHARPVERRLRAEAQGALAEALLLRGGAGVAEAVELARQALAATGERAAPLDTLARACDAAGDGACAAEAYRRLLASREPLSPEVRERAEGRLRALAP